MASETNDRVMLGLLMRLVAVFFHSTMNAFIKLAEERGASLAEILFWRQATAVPLLVALAWCGPGLVALKTRRIGAHTVRAAIGLTGMMLIISSVAMLPLAEAVTLQYTIPIFATILGAVFLAERPGWHRWGAVLVGFAGVLIVARPGSGDLPALGVLMALCGAVVGAIVPILLRHMAKTEGVIAMVFYFSALPVPPLAILYLFHFTPHDPWTWGMLVAIGVTGTLGQLAVSSALKYAPVSTVVPMDYSSIIWASLYGLLFFGVLPVWTTWAGAVLIAMSSVYIVMRERRLEKAMLRAGAEPLSAPKASGRDRV
ncbi:MAG: DMT family transporter [Novosphingobium sp.]